MKLVWTRQASFDRKHIRDYIAGDNPAAALAMDDLIADKVASLIEHAGLGHPGRVDGTRELVIHRNYLLIYDVLGEQIRVLRVLHAARRWPQDA